MRLAVTGGHGFIGAHVVELLAEAGHEVRSLDVEVTHTHPDNPRIECREVDILDLAQLSEALSDVEIVFHLAGMSNVDTAFADPVGTVRLNINGTDTVLEAARRCGLRRVVFASTVWVYGAAYDLSCGSEPLTEAAPMMLNRSGHIYTATKVAAEALIHSYAKTYGVPFTILRYGVPYGPGMRDELVLARFVDRAIRGESLTVSGDGKQHRNYVFVRDLARAHVLALDGAAENEVLALEGAERITVLDMARTVQSFFPGTSIEHVPARPADYGGVEVSNLHAADVIGWRPSTSFQSGVELYLEWYRSRHLSQR